MPVERRRKNSKTAAKLNEELLIWISNLKSSKELLSSLSDPNFQYAVSWGSIVRAHAMDLWEDDGEGGLAWHQTLANGVDFLHQFWSQNPNWDGQPVPALSTNGFYLDFIPGPVSQEKIEKEILENEEKILKKLQEEGKEIEVPKELRLLTMEDVSREIDLVPNEIIINWSRAIAPMLPSQDAPILTLATGFWLALSVAGRLTKIDNMIIGSEDFGWSAKLLWEGASEGIGPTGESIPMEELIAHMQRGESDETKST